MLEYAREKHGTNGNASLGPSRILRVGDLVAVPKYAKDHRRSREAKVFLKKAPRGGNENRACCRFNSFSRAVETKIPCRVEFRYSLNSRCVIGSMSQRGQTRTIKDRAALRWMAATLDGRVNGTDVFEAKCMLPWSFSEEGALQKYAPQLQHNMWVVAARNAVLSVITGGGKWVEIKTYADPLYQHLILTAERKFWRCVESGEPPALFGIEPPKPRIEAVRIVDMSASNAWAEFAGIFSRTRSAHLEHEQAKSELKTLMPDDAQQAIGHGVRAKRSKSGAVSVDLLNAGDSNAAVQ
jgi:hypothetical protein